jgi:hypothetical protein
LAKEDIEIMAVNRLAALRLVNHLYRTSSADGGDIRRSRATRQAHRLHRHRCSPHARAARDPSPKENWVSRC